MKFLKSLSSVLKTALALVIIMTSCQKEEPIENSSEARKESSELTPFNKEIPPSVLKQLDLLLFNNEDVQFTEFSRPDGRKEQAYLALNFLY